MERIHIDVKSAVCGAVLGGVSGTVLGYLLRRHIGERNYEARVEAEVAAVKAHYQARANDDAKREAAAIFQANREAEEYESGQDVPQITRLFQQRDRQLAVESMATAAEQDAEEIPDDDPRLEGMVQEEDDEDGEEIEGVVVVPEEPVGSPTPYRIGFAAFGERDTYQTLSCTYYTGDSVLADDKDQPVRNPVPIVGAICAEWFGVGTEHKQFVYVRNEELGVDFEIRMDERTYLLAILGSYGNPGPRGRVVRRPP